MKQFLKFTGFAVLSTAFAMAQSTTGSSQQQQPQQNPPQGASQSQGAIPAGAAQSQSGIPSTQPATPAAKVPAAKTQEEITAYNAALNNPDLAASATAADEFAKKFADSELKPSLYSGVMQKAFNSGKNDVVLDTSRKIVALQPEHTMALVMLATSLAESTKETDLDRDEKHAEAVRTAEKAIATIDKGLPLVAPQATPDQLAGAKVVLTSMAHSAMGYVAMAKKDWAAAEKHFKSSVAETGQQSDPVNYLRLAIAQDNLKKYKDGIGSAQKAIELAEAQQNTQIASMAKNEKSRLEKLAGQ